MDKLIFTVHQINEYVRGLLSRDPILQRVWVRGEISNFKLHSSGHMYFTLKDEADRIKCVMFRQNAEALAFLPRDGMKVLVLGYVSLYCKDGQYQLYAEGMEKDGIGDLFAAFEALKEKLRLEGLFDSERKKPIPRFPERIAVVTSHTGAAVRDIIHVITRRYPCAELLVIPVLVQGKEAPEQISAALDYVNTLQNIDVVIVGRGGGSIEELWAFNEEIVARAIARSRIPVISAVGHETDFTIADFVADLRAPTPSAAGELAVPDLRELKQMLRYYDSRLWKSVERLLDSRRKALERLTESYALRQPGLLVQQYEQQIDYLTERLNSAIRMTITQKRELLAKTAASLEALSPLAVLARGYAVVTEEKTNRLISSVSELKVGDTIRLHLKDGQVLCEVSKTGDSS